MPLGRPSPSRLVLVAFGLLAVGPPLTALSGCERASDARPARETPAARQEKPVPTSPGGFGDDAIEKKLDQVLAQQADQDRKLDYLIAKIEGLEKKIGSQGAPLGGAARRADPATVYAVAVDDGAVYGPKQAKVTMVMGFEFACPFCQRVAPTVDQLLGEYGADLRVVKMSYVVHPDRATLAAHAFCAAQEQGKHAEFEAKIWSDGLGKVTLDAPVLAGFAVDVGLDLDRFNADMASRKCKDRVAAQMQRLSAVGVSGTPAFFINGRYLSGARPIEQFRSLIDEELAKANAVLADKKNKKKITVGNYYDRVIMATGKKSL
jgi:protein-disulfide isomerase